MTTTMTEYSDKIKEFIITEVNPDLGLQSLDDDQPLIDSGIVDSLGVLRILAFLDEAFGIDLSGDEIKLQNFRTVRTICDLIARGGVA
jgi:acyl carrier protein